MAGYSQSLERLMAELGKLPGIGPRSAERVAFHLLKAADEEAFALAEAIRDLKTKIRPCRSCFNIAEGELCEICADPRRDRSVICAVEQPKDLLALEATGAYRGLYHVLMGHVAPLEDTAPEDLTIAALVARVKAGGVKEVILGTNPDVAGDATALHVGRALAGTRVKVTRLARGLPAGGQIEYATKSILTDAISQRREL
ncbi:MAG: recombination protein RecR [Phycisphaerae bacterium SM23_33]|nr:MAG: recombination protein RecR [Phycisphaerae bacterium SM23_33]